MRAKLAVVETPSVKHAERKLLVAMPGATGSFLLLLVRHLLLEAMHLFLVAFLLPVAMPGAPSSFLLLVAMPFAPSSVLAQRIGLFLLNVWV